MMLKNEKKHLSSQQVASCAEAILENRFHDITKALQDHLKECEICSAEVAMVVEITDPVEEVLQKPQARFDYKHPAINFLAAAMVLGLIVLVVFAILNSPLKRDLLLAEQEDLPAEPKQDQELTDEEPFLVSESEEEVPEIEEPSPSSEHDVRSENLLLANFTPNLELEMLVANYQTAYRGSSITVKAESSISFPGHTTISWNNPQRTPLLIDLFDNEGNEILSFSTSSDSFAIPQLEPGLYYWKLIEEEDYDLIFVGRITYQP